MQALLGERIKTLRLSKNLTQEDIAEKIGVSRQKYARIEKGLNNITLDTLSKLATVLDVTIGDITRVLDEEPVIAYRRESDKVNSSKKIFDMIDLFYANKTMYKKLNEKE